MNVKMMVFANDGKMLEIIVCYGLCYILYEWSYRNCDAHSFVADVMLFYVCEVEQ